MSSARAICSRSLSDLLVTFDTSAFTFTVEPLDLARRRIRAPGGSARCFTMVGSIFESKIDFAFSALPPPPFASPSKK